MTIISAKLRQVKGKKVKILRQQGLLPATLYGPQLKPLNLAVDAKEFSQAFKEAGESSLLSLKVNSEKGEKEHLVLIHQTALDPLSLKPIHVDFYQPNLEEEVEVTVPVIIVGESPVVKELGGTLVENIFEVEVRAKPQFLPKEITVSAETIKTFDDRILIKDLKLPEGVKIINDPEEVVALAMASEKVEEELSKPIEENPEEVEKVEKKPEEEAGEDEEK